MNTTSSLGLAPSYYLNVIGGNALTHNTRLVADTDGTLLIPGSTNTTFPSPYTDALLSFGPSPSTLVAPPSTSSASANTTALQYYVLKGPAGRGIYKLYVSSEVEPAKGMFGLGTRWEQWEVLSEAGMLFLRDKELAARGFWVAVPGEDARGQEAWVLWWLQPSGASIGVLEGGVMVDIEVVEEEGKE